MRSSLELLLLSLVREGLGNAYELKTRADISLGSAVPALARLESDGLLLAFEQARGGLRYTTTAAGDQALDDGWVEQLESTSSDIDSILRIAYLAWRQGNPQAAASYLDSAAERLRDLSTVAKAERARFGKRAERVDSDSLRWLRARVEARRIRAELEELTALASELRSISSSRHPASPPIASKKSKRSRNT